MASYMPQGYNVQSSYNSQQQKGLVYTAPRVGEYAALSGYKTQKGYVGLEQDNRLQSYNGKKTTNYGESGYLFSKMPEVMGSFGGELFTTRRLNDLVSENGEKAGFTFPEMEKKNPIQRSYEKEMVYKPQRREEQKKVEKNMDVSASDRGAKDTEIDTKMLAELIEQELKQFKAVNKQVHYV